MCLHVESGTTRYPSTPKNGGGGVGGDSLSDLVWDEGHQPRTISLDIVEVNTRVDMMESWNRFANTYTITVEDADNKTFAMAVTGEHPVWVSGDSETIAPRREAQIGNQGDIEFGEGAWLRAKDLKQNDRLLSLDGSELYVKHIQIHQGNFTVYNITVEGLHNYAVTDAKIIVHNK